MQGANYRPHKYNIQEKSRTKKNILYGKYGTDNEIKNKIKTEISQISTQFHNIDIT